METASLVGYAATLCSTVSFTPQAWKIIRSRSAEGLSAGTYFITVVGFSLWLTYGLLLGQWPLIITNGICLALSGFILAMTLLPPRKMKDIAEALDPV